MNYDLPTQLDVCGMLCEIRSDYRAALDVCTALGDQGLDNDERCLAAITILYPELESIPPEHYNEAVSQCIWFINCGADDDSEKSPKLMDWEQDFEHIVSPVNRIVGQEIRAMGYMHWWTFVSAYREIGDCLFSQIIGIRSKKMKNKALDKSEQEFYRQNRSIVDLKMTYSEPDSTLLAQWGVK